MRTTVWLGLLLAGCVLRSGAVVPNTGVPRPPETADSLDLHLRALVAGFEDEGLAPGGLLERGFLPPGGRAAYLVNIAPGECTVIVALATASLADLDASLYTAEGVALIEDDSASSRPSLTFCAAAQPVAAYLTLHAYQGAGSFVAAQFARAARPDDDLHTSFGEHGISALGQLAQTLHERGFEDAAPRVSLPLGDARPVRMALNVAAGECYTLAAEGGEGLAEVGIRLVDAEGGELAHGIGEPHLAALQYCANERAELAFEVVAKRGQGVARVARFRAAQALVGGARALWLGEPTPSASAWSGAKAKEARAARKPPTASERVELKQGEVVELEPKRARGACERWEAELQPGLWHATLRIENERGELLGEADAEHMQACLQICRPEGQRRISLIGRAGFGSVALFRSPVRAASPAASAQDSVAAPLCAPCDGADARVRCPPSSGPR